VNLLASTTGRRILFTALYAAEGAPIGFIWWALPTKLRAQGMPVDEITTLTSLLVLPWVFKFVWSPLIDYVRTKRWSLKSWIITFQVLMGGALLPLAIIPFEDAAMLLFPLLLAHALFASSQDAAIDALAISEVPAEERGSINGWMQAGMLAGRSLLGGGPLVVAGPIGDLVMMLGLVAIIWLTLVLLLFSQESRSVETRTESPPTLMSSLKTAIRRPSTWWGLAFAGVAGAAFEGVGSVAGPFLLDRGFTAEQTGLFFAFTAVVGMAFGALMGGHFADKFGTRRAVKLFLSSTIFSVVLLAALDAALQSPVAIFSALSVLYVAIGLFTASSYALFMEITDPRLGATQFSAFMGMTNVCESWSAFAVGRLTVSFGYPVAFAVMGALSFCTLPMVSKIKPQHSDPGGAS